MSKMTEIRSLSKGELVQKIRDDSKALFKLRLQVANATESLKTHQFRVYRKNIARYMTAMNELEAKQ